MTPQETQALCDHIVDEQLHISRCGSNPQLCDEPACAECSGEGIRELAWTDRPLFNVREATPEELAQGEADQERYERALVEYVAGWGWRYRS